MKFIKYEGEIPERRKNYSLKRYFEGFIKSNVKVAKIDTEDHYKSLMIAYNTLGKSAKKHGYPVKICRRSDEIFIIRTDM